MKNNVSVAALKQSDLMGREDDAAALAGLRLVGRSRSRRSQRRRKSKKLPQKKTSLSQLGSIGPIKTSDVFQQSRPFHRVKKDFVDSP